MKRVMQARLNGLDDTVDYASDFWSLLLCYVGPWGLTAIGGVLGWFVAMLDLWLAEATHFASYLLGNLAQYDSGANLEQGVGYVFYVLVGITRRPPGGLCQVRCRRQSAVGLNRPSDFPQGITVISPGR